MKEEMNGHAGESVHCTHYPGLNSVTLLQEGLNSMEGSREVRGLVLRLLASVLLRFPDALDFNPLWQPFFSAAEPLMQRLPTEVGTSSYCSASKGLELLLPAPPMHHWILPRGECVLLLCLQTVILWDQNQAWNVS